MQWKLWWEWIKDWWSQIYTKSLFQILVRIIMTRMPTRSGLLRYFLSNSSTMQTFSMSFKQLKWDRGITSQMFNVFFFFGLFVFSVNLTCACFWKKIYRSVFTTRTAGTTQILHSDGRKEKNEHGQRKCEKWEQNQIFRCLLHCSLFPVPCTQFLVPCFSDIRAMIPSKL